MLCVSCEDAVTRVTPRHMSQYCQGPEGAYRAVSPVRGCQRGRRGHTMTAFSSSKCATVEPSLPRLSCLCNSSLYAAAFFLHGYEPQNVYLMLKISNCSTASYVAGQKSPHKTDSHTCQVSCCLEAQHLRQCCSLALSLPAAHCAAGCMPCSEALWGCQNAAGG